MSIPTPPEIRAIEGILYPLSTRLPAVMAAVASARFAKE
eukprot:CAMPEP_0198271160 /NCGR_PEP_ID=MMETSP1447-20131203/48089_1 /TAXON_ID=420782 /ORGANISM="Chaetoceros dichaeta, Strain CCMP1751" /LENGTH=38 /DNA_ID= /DNA_START= /DNA_END= /DNA_ORIENTATION=